MPNLRNLRIAAILSGALLIPVIAHGHDTSAAASAGGSKGDMMMWVKDAEDKLVQLAAAMPEAKYAWKPAKDVRSAGEVFMHVATANYGIPSFLGAKPPEGFNFETYEKSLTKKADIQKALKESFAHMEQSLAGASDEDMEKSLEIFGMKLTHRGAYLMLLSHAHEHLGQSIAYARSNGVVPPWTAKQQAQMEEMEKAKKK